MRGLPGEQCRCFLFPVSCFLFPVSCFLFPVADVPSWSGGSFEIVLMFPGRCCRFDDAQAAAEGLKEGLVRSNEGDINLRPKAGTNPPIRIVKSKVTRWS